METLTLVVAIALFSSMAVLLLLGIFAILVHACRIRTFADYHARRRHKRQDKFMVSVLIIAGTVFMMCLLISFTIGGIG